MKTMLLLVAALLVACTNPVEPTGSQEEAFGPWTIMNTFPLVTPCDIAEGISGDLYALDCASHVHNPPDFQVWGKACPSCPWVTVDNGFCTSIAAGKMDRNPLSTTLLCATASGHIYFLNAQGSGGHWASLPGTQGTAAVSNSTAVSHSLFVLGTDLHPYIYNFSIFGWQPVLTTGIHLATSLSADASGLLAVTDYGSNGLPYFGNHKRPNGNVWMTVPGAPAPPDQPNEITAFNLTNSFASASEFWAIDVNARVRQLHPDNHWIDHGQPFSGNIPSKIVGSWSQARVYVKTSGPLGTQLFRN